MANRLFVGGAFVLVIAGMLVAFLAIGSPSHARAVALDERKVEDMRAIVARINARYGRAGGVLPPVLAGDKTSAYQKLSARRYRLCATFATVSEPAQDEALDGESWRHRAGRSCFVRDAGSD